MDDDIKDEMRARERWDAVFRSSIGAMKEAKEALEECAADIEAYVRQNYMPHGQLHPADKWRFKRDMEPADRARAAAAALAAELDG